MNMKAKPQLKLPMQEEQIRTALDRHWRASAAGDTNAEHDIYDDDAICDYPQSGEGICRPCGVTIPARRQALVSSAFLETGISGSRNTQLHTKDDGHIR
jgi:hypothetical protein